MRALVPVGDRAILKRIEKPRTQGRVVTGDLDDEESQECVVVVAPRVTNTMSVVVGDHVFIPKIGTKDSGWWKVNVDGEQYIVIDPDAILAVVAEQEVQSWDGPHSVYRGEEPSADPLLAAMKRHEVTPDKGSLTHLGVVSTDGVDKNIHTLCDWNSQGLKWSLVRSEVNCRECLTRDTGGFF